MFCFHSLLVQYRKRDNKPYFHDVSPILDPPLCNSIWVAIGLVWVGIQLCGVRGGAGMQGLASMEQAHFIGPSATICVQYLVYLIKIK